MAQDDEKRALTDPALQAPTASDDGTEAARDRLNRAGLRPTRQRLRLAKLLFGEADRHISAEALHAEVIMAGARVSLATVYNTLRDFTEAGLLREVAMWGTRSYFDTNTSNHSHFYNEVRGDLVDIPGHEVRVSGIPDPPAGMAIGLIDVVVRLVPDRSRRQHPPS